MEAQCPVTVNGVGLRVWVNGLSRAPSTRNGTGVETTTVLTGAPSSSTVPYASGSGVAGPVAG